MRELEEVFQSDKLPPVENPDDLREFLNSGALYDLAVRLEIVTSDESNSKIFSLHEDNGEFSVYWLYQERKRLLVIQNSMNRLPGLFLNLPVELDEYQIGPGAIHANFSPITEGKRVPEPYTEAGLVTIGKPQTVVKIMLVAAHELR